MKGWFVFRNSSLVLLGFLVFGCSGRAPEPSPSQSASTSTSVAGQPLIIRSSDSPTDGDSREPELNATHDGRIILSWVEKIGEKRYALRTSTRDGNGWSEARTVAQGENWFVCTETIGRSMDVPLMGHRFQLTGEGLPSRGTRMRAALRM